MSVLLRCLNEFCGDEGLMQTHEMYGTSYSDFEEVFFKPSARMSLVSGKDRLCFLAISNLPSRNEIRLKMTF